MRSLVSGCVSICQIAGIPAGKRDARFADAGCAENSLQCDYCDNRRKYPGDVIFLPMESAETECPPNGFQRRSAVGEVSLVKHCQ